MKNQTKVPQLIVKGQIIDEVKKYLTSSDEEKCVTRYDGCLLILPQRQKYLAVQLKHARSTFEPKVSLVRLDIGTDFNVDSLDDNEFGKFSVKMEPDIKIVKVENEHPLQNLSNKNVCVSKKMRTVKGRTTSLNYECKICQKKFNCRSRVWTHIREFHVKITGSKYQAWLNDKMKQGRLKTDGSILYKCVVCEARDMTIITYKKKYNLQLHLNEHLNNYNFHNVFESEMEIDLNSSNKVFDHPFGYLAL